MKHIATVFFCLTISHFSWACGDISEAKQLNDFASKINLKATMTGKLGSEDITVSEVTKMTDPVQISLYEKKMRAEDFGIGLEQKNNLKIVNFYTATMGGTQWETHHFVFAFALNYYNPYRCFAESEELLPALLAFGIDPIFDEPEAIKLSIFNINFVKNNTINMDAYGSELTLDVGP